jgi:hypothetical protein
LLNPMCCITQSSLPLDIKHIVVCKAQIYLTLTLTLRRYSHCTSLSIPSLCIIWLLVTCKLYCCLFLLYRLINNLNTSYLLLYFLYS